MQAREGLSRSRPGFVRIRGTFRWRSLARSLSIFDGTSILHSHHKSRLHGPREFSRELSWLRSFHFRAARRCGTAPPPTSSLVRSFDCDFRFHSAPRRTMARRGSPGRSPGLFMWNCFPASIPHWRKSPRCRPRAVSPEHRPQAGRRAADRHCPIICPGRAK